MGERLWFRSISNYLKLKRRAISFPRSSPGDRISRRPTPKPPDSPRQLARTEAAAGAPAAKR